MPTIHRSAGLRFVIYVDDHEPAHVHAIGLGGEIRIEIGRFATDARAVWVKGLSKADVSRAVREVVVVHARFVRAWVKIHGSRSHD